MSVGYWMSANAIDLVGAGATIAAAAAAWRAAVVSARAARESAQATRDAAEATQASADATRSSAAAARESAQAALDSVQSARELAAIENSRRHAELTPEFRYEFRNPNSASGTATLAIELIGPSQLDSLDSIVVSFRDDGMARGSVDNVFGPVRFEFGIDSAPNRVSSGPKSIVRGEFVLLHVERTSSHAEGWDGPTWKQLFLTQPVRLRIDCLKEGFAPWFVTVDLEGPPLHKIEDTIG